MNWSSIFHYVVKYLLFNFGVPDLIIKQVVGAWKSEIFFLIFNIPKVPRVRRGLGKN